MRVGWLAACALACFAQDAAAESWRQQRVGPWNVAAFHNNGEFRHCIMARAETGTQIGGGIVRARNALTIGLFSAKWKLDTGLKYPVTLVAGGETIDAQAAAAGPTTVSIDITGRQAFIAALSRAPSLQVRTPAATLSLPLERSADALEKLEACLATETGIASNPFGPGPQAAQSANPFAPAGQTAQPAPTAAAPTAAPPPSQPAPQPAASAAPRSNRAFVASAYGYLVAAGQRCPNVVFDQSLFVSRMSQAGFDINGAEEKATLEKELPHRLSMFEGARQEQECANALKGFGPGGTTIPGMLRR